MRLRPRRHLGLSESNVSHHLRVLRDHHLVRARRAGKMVFYAPDDEHIRLLLDLTREHVMHGRENGPCRMRRPGPRGQTGSVSTKLDEQHLELPLLLPRGAQCAGCVDEVGRELLRLDGVDAVEADLPRGLLRVRHRPGVPSQPELVRVATTRRLAGALRRALPAWTSTTTSPSR